MIVRVSLALLSWEVFAMRTRRPTITDLSHRWPWSLGVWAYLAWLFVHLVRAGRRG